MVEKGKLILLILLKIMTEQNRKKILNCTMRRCEVKAVGTFFSFLFNQHPKTFARRLRLSLQIKTWKQLRPQQMRP